MTDEWISDIQFQTLFFQSIPNTSYAMKIIRLWPKTHSSLIVFGYSCISKSWKNRFEAKNLSLKQKTLGIVEFLWNFKLFFAKFKSFFVIFSSQLYELNLFVRLNFSFDVINRCRMLRMCQKCAKLSENFATESVCLNFESNTIVLKTNCQKENQLRKSSLNHIIALIRVTKRANCVDKKWLQCEPKESNCIIWLDGNTLKHYTILSSKCISLAVKGEVKFIWYGVPLEMVARNELSLHSNFFCKRFVRTMANNIDCILKQRET